MVEFDEYSRTHSSWFGLESSCPAGPLSDMLLLRVMTFVPECNYWSLLAMVRPRPAPPPLPPRVSLRGTCSCIDGVVWLLWSTVVNCRGRARRWHVIASQALADCAARSRMSATLTGLQPAVENGVAAPDVYPLRRRHGQE